MFYFFQFSCYDLYMYVYNALGIGTLREICYFLKVGQWTNKKIPIRWNCLN